MHGPVYARDVIFYEISGDFVSIPKIIKNHIFLRGVGKFSGDDKESITSN